MTDGRKRSEHAFGLLWGPVSSALMGINSEQKDKVQEVRLYSGGPLAVFCENKLWYVCEDGSLSENPAEGFVVTGQHIQECFRKLCGYAVHTHEEEIAQGFISVQGGHRAGLGGTGFVRANGSRGLRDISSICLRISRQVKGCADQLMEVMNTSGDGGLLLAGPPGSGKSTLLRDMARQLSLQGKKVAVIDERGEISAVNGFAIECDLGPNCDVIAGVKKGEGIMMAVRCLSPQYIICDELGNAEEIEALSAGLCSGVTAITSIHAGNMEQLQRKPQYRLLVQSGAFERIAFLTEPGSSIEVKEVTPL